MLVQRAEIAASRPSAGQTAPSPRSRRPAPIRYNCHAERGRAKGRGLGGRTRSAG